MLGLSNAVMCGQKAASGGGSPDVVFLASYDIALNRLVDVTGNMSSKAVSVVTSPTHYLDGCIFTPNNTLGITLTASSFTMTSGTPWTLEFDSNLNGLTSNAARFLNFGSLELDLESYGGMTVDNWGAKSAYYSGDYYPTSGWTYTRVTWDGAGTFQLYRNNSLFMAITGCLLSKGLGGDIIFKLGAYVESIRLTKRLLTTNPTFPLTITP